MITGWRIFKDDMMMLSALVASLIYLFLAATGALWWIRFVWGCVHG